MTETALPDPSRCPTVMAFDPTEADQLEDPFALLQGFPEMPRVFYAPSINHYVVTRYSDIEAICLDPETFSSAGAQEPISQLVPQAAALLNDSNRVVAGSMLSLDPPDHARLRTPVARALSPERVSAMEPEIRRRASDLLDAVRGEMSFDLVSAYAEPLAAAVIFDFIGIPEADRGAILEWSAHRSALVWGKPSPAEQVVHASNVVAYREYLRNFVCCTRSDPDGAFTEALRAESQADPSGLSVDAIAAVLYSLTFAGHQTTSYLIGNAARMLLAVPDGWRSVVAKGPGLGEAVEEVVRLESSVPTMQRVTTRSVAVAGAELPAGTNVLLWLAAAGRDPIAYPDPEAWNPQRPELARSLGFGRGIHYCVGATLGRLEVTIALDALASCFPNMRLDPNQTLDFDRNLSFRGVRRLWVLTGGDSGVGGELPRPDGPGRLKP